ncbi:MAG: hypothetical protein ACK41F_08250 [Fimbriimonadaceae bacterium]
MSEAGNGEGLPAALWRRRAGMLAAFLGGQGASQGLSLLTGLLLLRWLSLEAYAQYSLAFAFQKVLSVLTDLGLQGSIVALVGSRGSDPSVVGLYVRAARRIRARTFLVAAASAVVAFPLLTARQGWPALDKALLCAAVVAFVWFEGGLLYGAPLLIARNVRGYYRAKVWPAFLRLGLTAAAWGLGLLTGWVAAWLAAIQTAWSARQLRAQARGLISEPEKLPATVNLEFWRYLGPLLPNSIYYAFQDQIAVGIVAWVGTSRAVAEVGALGRLAQIFLFLGAANPVLVAPLVARCGRSALPSTYWRVAAAVASLGGVLSLTGWLFPAPYLWLLGPRYAGLGNAIGWAVTAGSLALVAGTLFTMNAARRWVFLHATVVGIGSTLATQVALALSVDMSTALGASKFMAGTAASLFVGVAVAAWTGFRRDAASPSEG